MHLKFFLKEFKVFPFFALIRKKPIMAGKARLGTAIWTQESVTRSTRLALMSWDEPSKQRMVIEGKDNIQGSMMEWGPVRVGRGFSLEWRRYRGQEETEWLEEE